MIPNNELWVGGLQGLKDKYITGLSNVNRAGIKDLINYLQNDTDFFTAPASAKNHNNYKGGLVEHSLLVMQNIQSLCEVYSTNTPKESISLIALIHDICKVNFYQEDIKNIKIAGIWQQEPYYKIDDKFPLGHGEKSVIIIQKFIKLSDEEIIAIRWHMMGFDDSARQYAGGLALGSALDKYPLITLLHIADLAAVYLTGEK